MEYLVTMISDVPPTADDQTVRDTHAQEIARTQELADQDHMLRLWTPQAPKAAKPGETRTLGLFKAKDEEELHRLLQSLPMHVWSTFEVTPFQPHAHDPQRGS